MGIGGLDGQGSQHLAFGSQKAHKSGEGPATLAEKRALDKARRDQEEAEAKRLQMEEITFRNFLKRRISGSKNWQEPGEPQGRRRLCKKWLKPVIGSMPFKDIAPIHFERVKEYGRSKQESAES